MEIQAKSPSSLNWHPQLGSSVSYTGCIDNLFNTVRYSIQYSTVWTIGYSAVLWYSTSIHNIEYLLTLQYQDISLAKMRPFYSVGEQAPPASFYATFAISFGHLLLKDGPVLHAVVGHTYCNYYSIENLVQC